MEDEINSLTDITTNYRNFSSQPTRKSKQQRRHEQLHDEQKRSKHLQTIQKIRDNQIFQLRSIQREIATTSPQTDNNHNGDKKRGAATTVSKAVVSATSIDQSLGSRIELDGEIGGVKCRWLLDTGAQISVITTDLASSAKGKRLPPQHVPHTVDGSPLQTAYDLITDCKVGEQHVPQHRFTVVEQSTFPAIIGMDLIRLLNVTVSLASHTCYKSATNKMATRTTQESQTPSVCRIVTSQNVTIPARSMFILEGTVDTPMAEGQVGIVESIGGQGSERLGIGCGRVLESVRKDGKVLLHMTNPREKSCEIGKGFCVATFSTDVAASVAIAQLSTSSPTSTDQSVRAAQVDKMLREMSNKAEVTEHQKHRLYKLLHDNATAFSTAGETGLTAELEHEIPTADAIPIRQSARRVPYNRLQEIKNFVEDGLQNDIIRPSRSPWASPLVLVTKHDGTTRFCVDYRKLNAVTVGDSYPIPRIDDSLRALGGANIFSTLDLTKGYWQVPVKEEDRPKTAFTCHKGLYEFNTMPFGLKGAPATFQRLMTSVLGELNWEILLIYLDDIIVYSRSFDEHLEHLRLVLYKLRAAGLKLHPDKCTFCHKEVRYLGHVVSKDGVKPDPSKVRAISSYPEPKSIPELRRFLGMASYYRRFISRFSDIAHPLNYLTQKGVPFLWNDACQAAFSDLKQKLSSAPILTYPDFTRQFVVETDASDVGLGAVLCQDGRVIEYASRALNSAEKNYSATEKECLAVVWAIQERFGMYLEGFPFKIVTDHKPLTFLQQLKEPRGKLARWRVALDNFDFHIEHRPGKNTVVPDALSRAPCVNSVLLDGIWTAEEVMAYQRADEDVNTLITWVTTKNKPKNITNHVNSFIKTEGKSLKVVNGLLVLQTKVGTYVKSRTIIPTTEAATVLRALHDNAGHFGPDKVKASVKARFFWFHWARDVNEWCKSCEACLKRKNPTVPDRQPIGMLPTPVKPFQWWHMDFAGPLPTTARGNKYIFALTDPFSKWPEAFAVKDQTAQTTADIIYQEIICRFGFPEGLHTDQGRNFEAKLMAELCRRFNIKRSRSSPYNPQGNGLAERTNRTLAERLAVDIEAMDQTDWDDKLPSALAAMRTTVHKTTHESPFLLAFGMDARHPIDCIPDTTKPGGTKGTAVLTEKLDRLQKIRERVHVRILKEHAQRQSRQRSKTRFHPFPVGEKVWAFNPRQGKGLSKKLIGDRWKGPYKIVEKIGETTYKVRPTTGKGRSKIINHRRLKRHNERLKHLTDSETDEEIPTESIISDDEQESLESCWEITTDQEGEDNVPEQRQQAVERPQRIRNPPARLTYGVGGEQTETLGQSNSDDTDTD